MAKETLYAEEAVRQIIDIALDTAKQFPDRCNIQIIEATMRSVHEIELKEKNVIKREIKI